MPTATKAPAKKTAAKKAPAKAAAPDEVQLDSLADTVTALRRVRARLDKLDQERTTLERTIKAALGESEKGTVAGVPVVTWSRVKRSSVSISLLKQRHPDVAEECIVVQEVRTFKIDPA
jgi:predicted phage-related endonuclease